MLLFMGKFFVLIKPRMTRAAHSSIPQHSSQTGKRCIWCSVGEQELSHCDPDGSLEFPQKRFDVSRPQNPQPLDLKQAHRNTQAGTVALLGLTELEQTQTQLPADVCATRNRGYHRPPQLAKCSFMDFFRGNPCSALAELREGQSPPNPSPLQLPRTEQTQPPFQPPPKASCTQDG